MDFVVFRSARKRPTREKCNTFHTKTCFFKVRACAAAAGKAKKLFKNMHKNNLKLCIKAAYSLIAKRYRVLQEVKKESYTDTPPWGPR